MHTPLLKRKLHMVYLALGVIAMLLGGISHVRAEEPNREMGALTEGGMREAQMPPPPAERMAPGRGLTEAEQNRFVNLVRNASGRMEAAILRLENIVTRTEERMTKLKSSGIDTGSAEVSLEEAKKKLATARALLTQAQTTSESGLLSDTPRERFAGSRSDFREARQSIRDAFLLIRETLAILRDSALVFELNKRSLQANPNAALQSE